MKKIAALILALGLSACGVRPVYSSAPTEAGLIRVQQIDGRLGHRVRQELSRTLSNGLPGVEKGARLEVSLQESLVRLPLKPDDGVSRSDFQALAEYTLISADGDVLATGETFARASFDSAFSSYGDIALQSDALERVGRSLAKRIQQQLVIQASGLETLDETN